MAKPARPTTGRPVGWRVLGLLGIGVVVLLFGVWMGVYGPGSSSEPPPVARGGGANDATLERERWFALLDTLEQEIEARRELERDVAELRDALAVAGLLHETPGSPLSDPSAEGASTRPDEEAPEAFAPVAAGVRPGFDAAALVAAGIEPGRAAALRERWEEHQLEKLFLTDQAAREGWMSSPRHWLEQNAVVSRLRDEIGEEDYATLLYATGEPNAIEVTDVLARSPAHDAGLEVGDEILRYDGARVFRPNGLRRATSAGEPGEFVSIEVMRDGRPVTLRVRRGPLGVLLQGRTRPPPP
jgi:hypothetical protein